MQFKASFLVKIQALLFLLFIGLTYFYNRFAIDDYYFIAEISDKSFADAYKDLYMNWHGRWTSNFFLLGLIKGYNIPYFLFFVNAISFLLVHSGVYRIMKWLNTRYNLAFTRSTLTWYSIVFMSVFYYCNPSPSETWFWYTASVVYLWSIAAMLHALTALLKRSKNWLDKLFYAVGLLFIGGANEPMAILILVCFIYLLYKRYQTKYIALGLVILLTSFLVNYLSKGTLHRDEITPNLPLFEGLVYSAYATVDYLFFDFYKSFQIGIVLAIPFYILGKNTSVNIPFSPLRGIIKSILLIGIVSFLNAALGTSALGGLPPDRSMITSSLVISAVVCWFAFGLGNAVKSTKSFFYYVPIWGCIYLLLFLGYYTPIHRVYAKAVDQRIDHLKKSTENPIVVHPLPDSGCLYSAEITSDVKHFKNQHLKSGLGLDKDVVLDTNSLSQE